MITDCKPLEGYTDRSFLPLYGKMDWHHTMRDTKDGLQVTFRIEVTGPSALILAPVLKQILEDELPPAVDDLIALAEEA